MFRKLSGGDKYVTTYNLCPSCSKQPDPANFTVVRSVQGNRHMLLEVMYPNCSNYEGRKILLVRSGLATEKIGRKRLNPHFSKDGPVLARFEPTPEGWALAKQTLLLVG